MTRKDLVLGECRDAIHEAAERNKALVIALVGSVARGDDGPSSDYDFLVELRPEASLFDLAGLQTDLEGMLASPVDVVPIKGLRESHRGMLKDAILLWADPLHPALSDAA